MHGYLQARIQEVARVEEARKEGWSLWSGNPTGSLRVGAYHVLDTVLSTLYVHFNFILTTLQIM